MLQWAGPYTRTCEYTEHVEICVSEPNIWPIIWVAVGLYVAILVICGIAAAIGK